tara:strand:- start:269 stop:553 length:285 start_codon:yes stop_codon:yes gene_type:complete
MAMRINEIISENDRREFMKKVGKTAAATAAFGAGALIPSTAWPKDIPQDFNFMDQYFSDKVLKDPKYQEFKDIGKEFLDMIKRIEQNKKPGVET